MLIFHLNRVRIACEEIPLHRKTQMKVRFTFSLLFLLLTVREARGGMLRVVSIEDAQTIVVEAVTPTRIRLAGIEIVDREAARLFLEWALGSAWVSGERRTDGYMVWRSPDGMFVNRELVLRGYARALSSELETQRNYSVTYLGQLNPPLASRSPTVSAPPGNDSGTASPRRPRRSPQPRQPRKKRAARAQ